MRRYAVLVTLLFACGGGGEGPTDPGPQRTLARITAPSNCSVSLTQFPLRGTLTSVSGSYRTNEVSVWSGQAALDVEVPFGGAYRVEFYYGSSRFGAQWLWDYTVNIPQGSIGAVNLPCPRP